MNTIVYFQLTFLPPQSCLESIPPLLRHQYKTPDRKGKVSVQNKHQNRSDNWRVRGSTERRGKQLLGRRVGENLCSFFPWPEINSTTHEFSVQDTRRSAGQVMDSLLWNLQMNCCVRISHLWFPSKARWVQCTFFCNISVRYISCTVNRISSTASLPLRRPLLSLPCGSYSPPILNFFT